MKCVCKYTAFARCGQSRCGLSGSARGAPTPRARGRDAARRAGTRAGRRAQPDRARRRRAPREDDPQHLQKREHARPRVHRAKPSAACRVKLLPGPQQLQLVPQFAHAAPQARDGTARREDVVVERFRHARHPLRLQHVRAVEERILVEFDPFVEAHVPRLDEGAPVDTPPHAALQAVRGERRARVPGPHVRGRVAEEAAHVRLDDLRVGEVAAGAF